MGSLVVENQEDPEVGKPNQTVQISGKDSGLPVAAGRRQMLQMQLEDCKCISSIPAKLSVTFIYDF